MADERRSQTRVRNGTPVDWTEIQQRAEQTSDVFDPPSEGATFVERLDDGPVHRSAGAVRRVAGPVGTVATAVGAQAGYFADRQKGVPRDRAIVRNHVGGAIRTAAPTIGSGLGAGVGGTIGAGAAGIGAPAGAAVGGAVGYVVGDGAGKWLADRAEPTYVALKNHVLLTKDEFEWIALRAATMSMPAYWAKRIADPRFK